MAEPQPPRRALSRALAAPLAASAGGWQRCEPRVSPTPKTPTTRPSGVFLRGPRSAGETPARDLSIQGTEAARQQVPLPSPPPPACQSTGGEKDWVYLSDLAWQSARAGWWRNGDRLPRRDRDIEDNPMRLGNKTYRKGIGTHAPSEIVYALKGKYVRFQATVGAPEQGGTVVFRVLGDDKLLFDSGILRNGLEHRGRRVGRRHAAVATGRHRRRRRLLRRHRQLGRRPTAKRATGGLATGGWRVRYSRSRASRDD